MLTEELVSEIEKHNSDKEYHYAIADLVKDWRDMKKENIDLKFEIAALVHKEAKDSKHWVTNEVHIFGT